MLRRKHTHPTESIDMLRSKGLRQFTEVFTTDDQRLGVTMSFVHRPIEEVNDQQKLYRSYLVVQSLTHAGPVYVPTLYIGEYDPAANRLTLAVDMNTVMNEVWNRKPDFVAHGHGVPEELPG